MVVSFTGGSGRGECGSLLRYANNYGSGRQIQTKILAIKHGERERETETETETETDRQTGRPTETDRQTELK